MSEPNPEELLDQALAIAEKHLDAAITEAGPLSSYVAMMMVEAAVNAATEAFDAEDIVRALRDLADQIEKDAAEADED